MNQFKTLVSALLGVAFWLPCGATAWSAGFVFSTLADTADPAYSGLVAPALNDNGTVAFLATLDQGRSGVFTVAKNGTAAKVADTNGALIKDIYAPLSLNNSGQVAFTAALHRDMYSDDYGLFVGNGNQLTTIADSKTTNLTFFNPPSINNSGTVAFGAIVNGSHEGVYAGTASGITSLAQSDGAPIGGLIGLTPINDAGTIAFVAETTGGSKLFLTNAQGAPPTPIFTVPLANIAIGENVGAAIGIASNGDVLFPQGAGVFKVDPLGQISTIVEATGTPFQALHRLPVDGDGGGFVVGGEISLPSINDSGALAFFAVDPAGKEGIYLTSSLGLQKIVQAGDSLGGSTVKSLGMSKEGLNDAGNVAFFAKLADGRQVIVVATAVPEPASVLLFSFFAVVAAGRRNRR